MALEDLTFAAESISPEGTFDRGTLQQIGALPPDERGLFENFGVGMVEGGRGIPERVASTFGELGSDRAEEFFQNRQAEQLFRQDRQAPEGGMAKAAYTMGGFTGNLPMYGAEMAAAWATGGLSKGLGLGLAATRAFTGTARATAFFSTMFATELGDRVRRLKMQMPDNPEAAWMLGLITTSISAKLERSLGVNERLSEASSRLGLRAFSDVAKGAALNGGVGDTLPLLARMMSRPSSYLKRVVGIAVEENAEELAMYGVDRIVDAGITGESGANMKDMLETIYSTTLQTLPMSLLMGGLSGGGLQDARRSGMDNKVASTELTQAEKPLAYTTAEEQQGADPQQLQGIQAQREAQMTSAMTALTQILTGRFEAQQAQDIATVVKRISENLAALSDTLVPTDFVKDMAVSIENGQFDQEAYSKAKTPQQKIDVLKQMPGFGEKYYNVTKQAMALDDLAAIEETEKRLYKGRTVADTAKDISNSIRPPQTPMSFRTHAYQQMDEATYGEILRRGRVEVTIGGQTYDAVARGVAMTEAGPVIVRPGDIVFEPKAGPTAAVENDPNAMPDPEEVSRRRTDSDRAASISDEFISWAYQTRKQQVTSGMSTEIVDLSMQEAAASLLSPEDVALVNDFLAEQDEAARQGKADALAVRLDELQRKERGARKQAFELLRGQLAEKGSLPASAFPDGARSDLSVLPIPRALLPERAESLDAAETQAKDAEALKTRLETARKEGRMWGELQKARFEARQAQTAAIQQQRAEAEKAAAEATTPEAKAEAETVLKSLQDLPVEQPKGQLELFTGLFSEERTRRALYREEGLDPMAHLSEDIYQPRAFYDPQSRAIRILNTATADDVIHEFFHHIVATSGRMPVEMQDTLRRVYGGDEGVWNNAAEEKAVRGFLRYIRDKEMPIDAPKGLREAFSRLRSVMASSLEITSGFYNDETLAEFDKMFGLDKPGEDVRQAAYTTVARTMEALEDADFESKAEAKAAEELQGLLSESRGNNLGFYSPAERAIDSLKQETFTPQQLKAQVAKTPGVKAQELEETGFNDWLDGTEGKVTKGQAIAFLQENGPRITEVFKGSTRGYAILDRNTGEELDDGLALADAEKIAADNPEWEIVESDLPATTSDTKFGQYQLPGGENYREVLLTLPSNIRRLSVKDFIDSEHPDSGTQDFTSSHWDEPNVLAHIRLNDRTDSEGRKTLFVEEIQSDWHQEGKKRGYQKESKPLEWEDAETSNGNTVIKGAAGNTLVIVRRAGGDAVVLNRDGDAVYDRPGMSIEEAKQMADNEGKPFATIPDAPFKGSKAWAMLAFKRVLKMAVDGGYDAVSWTPGEVQNDRYSLDRQVESIDVEQLDDDKKGVVISPKTGDTVSFGVNSDGSTYSEFVAEFDGKRLDEVVGKEMADKIMGTTDNRTFEGLDLKVGGQGMKGFYDNILPKEVQKYVKKLDKAAKVGTDSTQTGQEQGWSVVDVTDDGNGEILERFDTREAAQRWQDETQDGGTDVRQLPTGAVEVWSLPITDKMRNEIEAGQPMFSEARAGLTPEQNAEFEKKASTLLRKRMIAGLAKEQNIKNDEAVNQLRDMAHRLFPEVPVGEDRHILTKLSRLQLIELLGEATEAARRGKARRMHEIASERYTGLGYDELNPSEQEAVRMFYRAEQFANMIKPNLTIEEMEANLDREKNRNIIDDAAEELAAKGVQEMLERPKKGPEMLPASHGAGATAAISNTLRSIWNGVRSFKHGLGNSLLLHTFGIQDLTRWLANGNPNSVWHSFDKTIQTMNQEVVRRHAMSKDFLEGVMRRKGMKRVATMLGRGVNIEGKVLSRGQVLGLAMATRNALELDEIGEYVSKQAEAVFQSNGKSLTGKEPMNGGREAFGRMATAAWEYVQSNQDMKNTFEMMDEYYQWIIKEINEYRRLTGETPVGEVVNYFPLIREGGLFASADQMAEQLGVAPDQVEKMLSDSSRWKSRVATMGGAINLNAMDMFNTYKLQADTYLGKHAHIRMMEQALAGMSETLTAKDYGAEASMLRDLLHSEKFYHGRYSPMDAAEQLLHLGNAAYKTSIFSGNIGSALKQPVSIMTGMSLLPFQDAPRMAGNFMRYAAKMSGGVFKSWPNVFQGDKYWDMMVEGNSRHVHSEYSIIEAGLQEPGTGLAGIEIGGVPLGQTLLLPIRHMDMLGRVTVWSTAYESKMRSLRNSGKSEQAMHKESFDFAESVTMETQPSPDNSGRAMFQKKNEWLKALTPFTSQPFRNWNLMLTEMYQPMRRAWQNGYKAGGHLSAINEVLSVVGGTKYAKSEYGVTTGTGQKTLFTFVLPAMALSLIARGRPPKDFEEFMGDLLAYNIVMVPILGPIVATKLMYDRFSEGAPLYSSFLSGAADVFVATAKGEPLTLTRKAVRLGAMSTGFPMKAVRFAEKWLDEDFVKSSGFDAMEALKWFGLGEKAIEED